MGARLARARGHLVAWLPATRDARDFIPRAGSREIFDLSGQLANELRELDVTAHGD